MADVVKVSVEGPVGLVAIANPPVNAASAAVRAGLVAALDTLEADPAVAAIALYGDGRSFIAGADIREFGQPPADPWLPELCDRIERCGKPIVAVLHGAALGGGLEVALAAHARVALPGVTLGFPEVGLGILPGAGGTQRTPRLIGQRAALDLITTGRRIGAQEAADLGLIDRIDEGPPRAVALSAATALMAGTLPARKTGDARIVPDPAAIEAARERIAETQPHLFSPLKCVEAVAAAALPLADGLAEERRLFQACMQSPQRAALIHAFFAERAVAKIPEAGATARPITRIGIVGAGTMGSGIATAALLAGLPVRLVEPDATAAQQGVAAIDRALDGAVSRGKLSAQDRAARRPEMATDLAALTDCDLIIEAAYEDLTVKRGIFETLGRLMPPEAILATNTSYLDIDAIAAASGRPAQVMGLHFFSPAHVMKLLEVVVGRDTAPETVATGFSLAKILKKTAVRAGVCDGFIGNRIMSAYRQAADFMLLDGTPADRIDAALRDFGFKMGPFEMSDLAGLDIGWATRKRLAPTRDPAARYHGLVADGLCETGQLGRKTGAGYYLYDGDTPRPNPAVAEAVARHLAAEGRGAIAHAPDDIVARFLTALIAEAARVLEEGIALRPIDIDAVFLFGYGFPRWKGGPMHHADTLGPAVWCDRIARYAQEDPAFWRIPPLLQRLAAEGRLFADLDRDPASVT
jgi:3-hydroxyacyl-CoA dehydrogenase